MGVPQAVEWIMQETVYPWRSHDGPVWLVYVHWARVNEQVIPVGVDIRGFHERPDGVRQVSAGGLAPLNLSALRGIPLDRILEATHRTLISRPIQLRAPRQGPHRRGGRPPKYPESMVAEAAAMYCEVTEGRVSGADRQHPWMYVRAVFAERGVHLGKAEIANLRARAIRMGLL